MILLRSFPALTDSGFASSTPAPSVEDCSGVWFPSCPCLIFVSLHTHPTSGCLQNPGGHIVPVVPAPVRLWQGYFQFEASLDYVSQKKKSEAGQNLGSQT